MKFSKISTLFLLASLILPAYSFARVPQEVKISHAKKALENAPSSTRAMGLTDIIYNPQGEYKYYTRDITGLDDGNFFTENGDAALVVFGDDNSVYFQDLVPFYFFRNFVKGTLENGVITVNLPQTVSLDYLGLEYPVNLCVLQKVNNEFVVSDQESVQFMMDETTGSITMELPSKQHILGYVFAVGDGIFIGDGNYADVFTPFEGVNSLPENSEEVEYMFREGEAGYPVGVVKENNKMFIRGLSQSFPQCVIEANESEGNMLIPQNQIIGAAYGAWVRTRCLETGNNELVNAPETAQYPLHYYPEANLYIGYDDIYFFCLVAEYYDGNQVSKPFFELFDDFQIFYQTSYEGIPANPFNLNVNTDNVSEGGTYLFGFVVPVLSTQNTVLDYQKLYYRIYVDGDLMEFEADPEEGIYDGIEGEITDIPFEFSNDWDIWAYTYNIRFIQLYTRGISTLGVQSVYKYGENTTYSDVVTIDIETGGITTSPAGINSLFNSENGETSFYDLTGRKVSNPSNGVYIMKKPDGKGGIKTSKVMIK